MMTRLREAARTLGVTAKQLSLAACVSIDATHSHFQGRAKPAITTALAYCLFLQETNRQRRAQRKPALRQEDLTPNALFGKREVKP